MIKIHFWKKGKKKRKKKSKKSGYLFHRIFISVGVSNICQTRQKEDVPPCSTSFASLFDFVAHRFIVTRMVYVAFVVSENTTQAYTYALSYFKWVW